MPRGLRSAARRGDQSRIVVESSLGRLHPRASSTWSTWRTGAARREATTRSRGRPGPRARGASAERSGPARDDAQADERLASSMRSSPMPGSAEKGAALTSSERCASTRSEVPPLRLTDDGRVPAAPVRWLPRRAASLSAAPSVFGGDTCRRRAGQTEVAAPAAGAARKRRPRPASDSVARPAASTTPSRIARPAAPAATPRLRGPRLLGARLRSGGVAVPSAARRPAPRRRRSQPMRAEPTVPPLRDEPPPPDRSPPARRPRPRRRKAARGGVKRRPGRSVRP